MFAPLHVKSDFSAGHGTATVDELVRCAAAHGWPALALTDVENLYGQVQLHAAARARGLRPITGVELRAGHGPRAIGARAGRLVLLARDRAGYESLCRIVTLRRREPERPTGAPIECLGAEPRGVFFLSDDPAVVGALIRAGVPAADVRFLLVRPGGGVAAPAGVRAAADTDVVMAHAADAELHALRLAIRQRRRIEAVLGAEPGQRSFADPAALAALFADAPDALAESLRIAEACELRLDDSAPILPSLDLLATGSALGLATGSALGLATGSAVGSATGFALGPATGSALGSAFALGPPGQTADHVLGAACRARLSAARRDGRCAAPAYDARLDRELEVIRTLGLAGYLLVVGEIAAHAGGRGIPVVGRGSAVSSLVAHLLGLTAVDPVAHGLYFERFLHAGRRDLPDIDLDLPSDRRDEVLDWVFRRFGPERVAMVAAHQRFQRRSAFREGLKALGMRAVDVDRFCARLPADELADDVAAHPPLELLTDRCRRAVPLIERLVGTFQHLSVHPGGVVIASPSVATYAPLERAPKGVRVTQYDMRAVAALGLVKIDLLGNRALAAIDAACRIAGIRAPDDEGDAATLDALRHARTVGCFQVETPAVRSTLRRLPLRGLPDLIAALAVVRPGPASGEAKAAYIRRAHGEEPAEPPHPRLAAALRETYGMLLYEEDLMAAIALMTGWPLERADQVREALVRDRDDPLAMTALEAAFRTAAAATGVPEAESARVWDVLARFAAYSFSKAHAASYARLAWQAVFLKTHRPVELACAVLEHYGGHYPLRTVAAEFARAGVPVLAPHVNASGSGGTVQSGAVRLGLGAIGRVTAASRRALLAARPFADVRDLLSRVALSHREVEALVLSGACDDLAPLGAEAYPFAHEDLVGRLRQVPPAVALEGFAPRRASGERLGVYRALVRIRNELRFLQMHPSAHPMAVLRDEATRAGCVAIADLAPRAGHTARVAGIVAATRRLATRTGPMQFVTLEDETGLVEAVLFPATYSALRDPVTTPGPYLVTAHVATDHGDIHLITSTLTPFHSRNNGVRS